MSGADQRPEGRAASEARQRSLTQATLLSLVVLGVVYGVERRVLTAVLVAIAVWLLVYVVVSRQRSDH